MRGFRSCLVLCALLVACDDGAGDKDDDSSDGLPGLNGDDGILPGSGGDSDGDGWSNSEENAAGTNPDVSYSHPYTGGYNVGWCDALPEPTGPTGSNGHFDAYQEGDVAENFTLVDQYGEEVDLYSFCGQHVMIAFGASWCPPCQELAMEVQDIQDEYAESGFQAIEILIEDEGYNPPDQQDLLDWEAMGGMTTIPVLSDAEQTIWPVYELDWGIPTIIHLGPDMTVLSADAYVDDPGQFLD